MLSGGFSGRTQAAGLSLLSAAKLIGWTLAVRFVASNRCRCHRDGQESINNFVPIWLVGTAWQDPLGQSVIVSGLRSAIENQKYVR